MHSLPVTDAVDDVHRHTVQFYSASSTPADTVVTFIREGLAQGESSIIIAIEAHRSAITAGLRAAGVDVASELESRRLLLLDAQDVLGTFMVDGTPDAERFESRLSGVLERIDRSHGFRAYGEMVDVLWRAGNEAAALELEELWNAFQTKHAFKLHCAYALDSFSHQRGLADVCARHTHVLPAEPGSAQSDMYTLLDEITRRTRVEAELRKSVVQLQALEQEARERREQLEDFLENAAMPIHRVDKTGVITWANAAELRTLGYEAHEYIGRHIADFHIDRPVIDDILARLVAGETLQDCDARLRARDGSIRHVAITSNVQRRHGEFITTRCFSRDVTAQKRAEEEREQANRAKDEFLAMLGHELRNPLSPILTAVQLMRLRGETSSAREQDIIERQVNHLVHLVDDLLDVSRIASGKVELQKRATKLASVIAKATEMVASLYKERQQTLEVSVSEEDIWLEADETRLCQVVVNLLTNAARYTPPRGRIQLRAFAADGRVCIHVKDNGSGIEADVLPRIFDLFVQGKRSTTRSQGGLGVGLALVRNLVELHGGTVSASSEGPGLGSEFVVQLPPINLSEGTSSQDRRVHRRVAVSPRKILIVDDNEDAGLLMGEMLRSVGHEVAIAITGSNALGLLERFSPDVALLDLDLPDMTGYELAGLIRERLGSVNLVAVTGYGQEKDRARVLEGGFAGHLVKPVGFAKVLAAIEVAQPPT